MHRPDTLLTNNMFIRSFLFIGASLLFAATGCTAQNDPDATVPTDLATGMLDVTEVDEPLNLPKTGSFVSGCQPKRLIVDDDFENHSDFHGWKNAKKSHSHKLTTFLGRYAKGDRNKPPYKTFGGINKNADQVKLMIDFYEIDSWDANTKYGPDRLWIRIDNVKLSIGGFHVYTNEKAKSGSAGGISWSSKSLGAPAHLGFNKRWKDQKHRFTILIPNKYYKNDGKITIKLGAEVTSSKHDESAGWDNIKIYELNNCHRRLGDVGDNDPLMEENVVDDVEYGTEEDYDADTDADTTAMTTIESLFGSMLTSSEGAKLRGAAVA